jgi:hypothetical protein
MEGVMNRPDDLIKTAEAQRLLAVGKVKMAQLIKDGIVRYYTSPLDKRVKLVSRAEILVLKNEVREAA